MLQEEDELAVAGGRNAPVPERMLFCWELPGDLTLISVSDCSEMSSGNDSLPAESSASMASQLSVF